MRSGPSGAALDSELARAHCGEPSAALTDWKDQSRAVFPSSPDVVVEPRFCDRACQPMPWKAPMSAGDRSKKASGAGDLAAGDQTTSDADQQTSRFDQAASDSDQAMSAIDQNLGA